MDLNHAQNVLDLAKEVKKSGGNYDMLNKKGARYISRIQKEFRHKLNENYLVQPVPDMKVNLKEFKLNI